MTESTPRYGHAPVKMNRVTDDSAMDTPGDFLWDVLPDGSRFILVSLPRPRPEEPEDYIMNRLPVKKGPNSAGKWWGWDGNEDVPTLTPSVHCVGHWHGFIRAGFLVEA